MNAPISAAEVLADPVQRARLNLAGQIASGLVSNPGQLACRNWEGETARAALRVADKLLCLIVSGGC